MGLPGGCSFLSLLLVLKRRHLSWHKHHWHLHGELHLRWRILARHVHHVRHRETHLRRLHSLPTVTLSKLLLESKLLCQHCLIHLLVLHLHLNLILLHLLVHLHLVRVVGIVLVGRGLHRSHSHHGHHSWHLVLGSRRSLVFGWVRLGFCVPLLFRLFSLLSLDLIEPLLLLLQESFLFFLANLLLQLLKFSVTFLSFSYLAQ